MSGEEDLELRRIKMRMLADLQKRLVEEKQRVKREVEVDLEGYLAKNLTGRAKEVLRYFRYQYPTVYRSVVEALAKALMGGLIPKPLDASTLYRILLNLGLKVRLPSRIYVAKRGEVKDFSDYVKDRISREES